MERIIEFLLKNGYIEDSEMDAEHRTFIKDNVCTIDVNEYEIVFIGDSGDWLHIPSDYYALIGALFHHRQIAIDYLF